MRLMLLVFVVYSKDTLHFQKYTDYVRISKILGGMGILLTTAGVISDIKVEDYYENYKKSVNPDSCVYYRERVRVWEKIRDIVFTGSVISFGISAWLYKKAEKLKQKFYPEIEIDFKKRKTGVRICIKIGK